MKKILLAICVAMIVTLPNAVSAQISIGPKAGFNYNSFHKKESLKNFREPVSAFHAGIFGSYPALEFLTVRGEILYNLQATRSESYRALSDLYRKDVNLFFHTLSVPVIAEFGLPGNSEASFQPKLLIGGSYSYLFYARETYQNVAQLSGRQDVAYKGFTNVTSQFNNHQLALIAGLGARVDILSIPLLFDVRYQYNLNPLNNSGTAYSYNLANTHEKWGKDLFLHTLTVSVGAILFKL